VLKLINRFEILDLLRAETPEAAWTAIRQTYNDAAYKVLGMKKSPNEERISAESWDLIEKRPDMKNSLLNTFFYDASQSLELEYALLDKSIKKSLPVD
jgi:hypothetical protein